MLGQEYWDLLIDFYSVYQNASMNVVQLVMPLYNQNEGHLQKLKMSKILRDHYQIR